MNDSTIYQGEWLSFYPITPQARQFLDDLDDRGWLDFTIAATILEMSLQTGRPPAGRAERVRGSVAGLFELRVTPPGRRGPHTRLLYVCEKRRVLVARGVLKRQARISRHDIDLADRAVREYREASGEPASKGRRRAGRAPPGV